MGKVQAGQDDQNNPFFLVHDSNYLVRQTNR
jgi:hypothetical protein